MTLVEPTARAGARVLRARPGRARVPRGRRAARISGASWPYERRGRRARRALPRRREPRAVGRGLRRRSRDSRPSAGADDHRRGAGGRRALGGGARPPAASRARTGRASRSTRSTSRRRPGETGLRPATPRRPRACSCRPAPPRTRSSSASIRWRATPTASAGARSRRSRRAARGSGSRTASCCSRPRRRRGRRAPCSSQQVWVDPAARGRGYGARGLRDLFRLLLDRAPAVTLFVRSENAAAIGALRAGRDAAASSSTGACCFETGAQATSLPSGCCGGRPASWLRAWHGGGPRDERRLSFSSASRPHIRRHELIEPGGEVLCLVSGGADSTCLYHVAARARLPRVGAARRPRAARRGVRRGRSLVRRARSAPRSSRPPRAARRRPSCATSATRSGTDAPARDRPHALRPGRDDPLPARLEREHARDQGAARGRRRPPAALRLARGDRGVLPRARARVAHRLVATRRRCAG